MVSNVKDLYDRSLMKYRNPIAEEYAVADIVADKERAKRLLDLNLFDKPKDTGLRQHIESTGRFVENEEAWVNGDCACKCNALSLTAAQLKRISVQDLGGEPDKGA